MKLLFTYFINLIFILQIKKRSSKERFFVYRFVGKFGGGEGGVNGRGEGGGVV
jgi:hypothetical protein